MKTQLLTGVVVAKALFPASTPEAERQQHLRNFFQPAIGSTAHMDTKELHNPSGKDPLTFRGYIRVSPPSGACWIIQRQEDEADQRLCRATTLSFSMKDLDVQGQLHWLVKTGDGDFGTPITWPTPYRLAQIVPVDRFKDHADYFTPTLDCQSNATEKSVAVTLMNGQRYLIQFPTREEYVPKQPEPFPNLFMRKSEKELALEEGGGHAGIPKTAEVKAEANWWNEYKWTLPVRQSFTMPAGQVTSSSFPPSPKGTCRYRYQDAPGDAKSGLLECLQGDTFDVLILPLTCGSSIKANPLPLPEKKSKG